MMQTSDRINQLRLRLAEAQKHESTAHHQYMQAAAYVCRIREQLEDLLLTQHEDKQA
jgi:ribosome-interacting GTPase 1